MASTPLGSCLELLPWLLSLLERNLRAARGNKPFLSQEAFGHGFFITAMGTLRQGSMERHHGHYRTVQEDLTGHLSSTALRLRLRSLPSASRDNASDKTLEPALTSSFSKSLKTKIWKNSLRVLEKWVTTSADVRYAHNTEKLWWICKPWHMLFFQWKQRLNNI